MNDTQLRYVLELGGRTHFAREARGDEALSSAFRIEVTAILEGSAPSPRELVDQPAQVHLERAGVRLRTITGIATSVRVVAAPAGAPELRVVVEPRLVLARYRSDLRIFRDKSVPVIVTEVLARIGVTPELRLQGSYQDRPYCVQYRETDHDFVCRLLEDEGIFFFFLEGTMVLGDGASAYEPLAGGELVPFRDASGMDDDREAVLEIGSASAVAPGRFSLRDFNTDHPSLNMDVGAPGPFAAGPEFYDYPGEFAVPSEGERKARLMAEAATAAWHVAEGKSSCPRLGPGRAFVLADAPPGAPEGRLVVTRLRHDFRRTESGFSNELTALPVGVVFRPPRVTPVPVVTSPQTGIVTGPPGQDIHTDAYGRVKVHFHWDRRQPYDDQCSDWVPVLQENTGSSCAIPRIGWEVLVHFLEGDPDRPVVLGRVWNGDDELPFVLPQHKTWSQLRSFSSPRAETMAATGNNMISFRDLAGMEEIAVQAERDQHVAVANDKRITVQNGEVASIGRDETWSVGSMQTVKTGVDHSTKVSANQAVAVGGNRKAEAGIDVTASVTGNRSLSIGGMHLRKIGDVDGAGADKIVERVGGVILEASVAANAARADNNARVTVGGAVIEVAGGNKTTTSSWGRVETVGGVVLTRAKGSIQVRSGRMRRTMVGGALKITALKVLQLGAKKKVSVTSPQEIFTGKQEVTLKVGETEVVIKEGVVRIKTATEITIDVTGPAELGAGDSIQI